MSDDDKPKPFDVPLENVPGSQPFGAPVIDFGGIRVKHGLRRHMHRQCEHKKLIYSTEERRIWCEDCERTIEAFDAFMTYTRHWHEMKRAAMSEYKRAVEAKDAHLTRRAAKEMDRNWSRGMAPQCPRCSLGLLPEDFAGEGLAYGKAWRGNTNAEFERARRKKETAPSGQ